MTDKECKAFIAKIAPFHIKYAKLFGFKTVSASIAQACLESAYGTSNKVVNKGVYMWNMYGLKYKSTELNRCPSGVGFFYENGTEQYPNGAYTDPTRMSWWRFPSMEMGVKGYYEFLLNGKWANYSDAKSMTTPRAFLQILKDKGYATSLKYVDNVMAVVDKWGLCAYDVELNAKDETPKEGFKRVIIDYTLISPNKNHPRNHKIDTITIHHMAGNLSIESCANLFSKTSRQASSNYVIGTDGRIGLCVPEEDRAWTSGNKTNDHRAITIEVANDNTQAWSISDKAMNALVRLCADICSRNGIEKLVWSNNKTDRVNHLNGANMTVHRDFQATACPGEWLFARMGMIADSVNAILGGGEAPKETNPYPVPQRVLKKTTPTTTGDDVKWLQWTLVKLGYLARFTAKGVDNIDGRFGSGTESAVKAYQSTRLAECGCKNAPDGSVGGMTRASLLKYN